MSHVLRRPIVRLSEGMFDQERLSWTSSEEEILPEDNLFHRITYIFSSTISFYRDVVKSHQKSFSNRKSNIWASRVFWNPGLVRKSCLEITKSAHNKEYLASIQNSFSDGLCWSLIQPILLKKLGSAQRFPTQICQFAAKYYGNFENMSKLRHNYEYHAGGNNRIL